MKTIASSRLREAQNRMEIARPFAVASLKAIDVGPPVQLTNGSTNLIIPVLSDRGLCGGINSYIAKALRAMVRTRTESGVNVKLFTLGDKALSLFRRDQVDRLTFSALQTSKRPLNMVAVSMIMDKLTEVQWDTATIIYNHFNNVVSFSTIHKDLNGYNSLVDKPEGLTDYEFEDDNQRFHLRDLAEWELGSLIYAASAQGAAAELGARMSAMDNATRNANDILKRLDTEYNRGRQAAITTELTEIISGAAALD